MAATTARAASAGTMAATTSATAVVATTARAAAAVAAARCGVGVRRSRIAGARCGIRSRRRIRTRRRRTVRAGLRGATIPVVRRIAVGSLRRVVGSLRRIVGSLRRIVCALRRLVRAAVVGIVWPAAVVVGRRRTRGRGANGSRLRIPACPRRTICILESSCLRGLIRGVIGASETCRPAAAIRGIPLRFPDA